MHFVLYHLRRRSAVLPHLRLAKSRYDEQQLPHRTDTEIYFIHAKYTENIPQIPVYSLPKNCRNSDYGRVISEMARFFYVVI